MSFWTEHPSDVAASSSRLKAREAYDSQQTVDSAPTGKHFQKNKAFMQERTAAKTVRERHKENSQMSRPVDTSQAGFPGESLVKQRKQQRNGSLPADLSPERRTVVKNACSLVGKVGYYWGGKSLVIGWDSRWGQLWKVTAAGSPTTGTYRPYGLDCSGMVDWAFYNASGGQYIIGHGGGASAQHSYCTDLSWDEAQPGDLVFYPGDEHVGIVGGWDENGDLLIIHCASGYNNVVIMGLEGFTAIARPNNNGRASAASGLRALGSLYIAERI